MQTTVAVYCRTSTDRQETGLESQLRACRAFCHAKGFTIHAEYQDDGVSGKEDSRPEFDRMLAALRAGEFNVIVVYSMSRLSRRVAYMATLIEEFVERETVVHSTSEPVDLTNPTGRAMVLMTCVFGQLERETIVERTMTGLKNARAKGSKSGPKVKRDDAAILELLDQGFNATQIARNIGCTRAAVYRAQKARTVRIPD